MATAGATIIAGQVSGERIADNTVTADSATFTTTETVVQTVVAALVTGRKYKVRWFGHIGSSVAGDRMNWRIREDSVSGTIAQEMAVSSGSAHSGSSLGEIMILEIEFTAVATGSKTFVVTGVRASGTGNVQLEGAATRPNYLTVDYISG